MVFSIGCNMTINDTDITENMDPSTTQGTGVRVLTSLEIFEAAERGEVRALFEGDIIEDPETGVKVEQWTQVWNGEPEFLHGVPFTRPTLVHSLKRPRESYYSLTSAETPKDAA